MDPSVVACGRCGASNPQDAEFCETCGAFLAAYQAPAGATETVAALTQPAESTPTSEISYTPPAPPPPQAPTIVVEEPPQLEDALDTGLVEEEPIREVQIETEEVISEPVPSEVVATAETPREVDPQPMSEPPPRPRPHAYTPPPSPPPSPPQMAPEPETPIPAIYKAVFGKYAEIAYPADRLSGTGRTSHSPQTLILMGVAALLGVCVAAMVASSSSVIFLLIGGPIACTLIAIGVLILVGRYPTGRP